MAPEYREGPEARERFEQAMRTAFQAPKPKTSKKEKPKPATVRKTKRADKD
jgi:hypothetical protein